MLPDDKLVKLLVRQFIRYGMLCLILIPTILIAPHKYTGAQEIMARIRYVYEMCADFGELALQVITKDPSNLKMAVE